jgi:hypothetical protein
MVRRRTIAATTSALFATTLIVTACSSDENSGDDDDDDNGGSSGTSAGGKGGSTAGGSGGTTAGTGTAGSSSGSAGTSAGMAGTTGTAADTAGTGGSTAGASGSGGSAGMEGYSCKGVTTTCDTISDFPSGEGMCWGTGDFKGGVGQYGGLTLDTTGGDIHVSGEVSTYSGFNIWFSYCSDLSAYTGISFTLSGMVMSATAPNTIDFQLQTNSNYPWQADPSIMKGACTSDTPDNPWGDCIASSSSVPIPADSMPVMVTWAQVTGGAPVPFSATTSPKEILGLQWQFPWAEGATAYMVDVHVDNITFIGGTATACSTGSCSGSGGAGGAGGSAGASGSGGWLGGAGAGGTAGGGAGGTGGTAGAGTGGGGTAGTAGATGGGGSGGGGSGGKGGSGGSGGGTGGKGGGGFGGAGKGGA